MALNGYGSSRLCRRPAYAAAAASAWLLIALSVLDDAPPAQAQRAENFPPPAILKMAKPFHDICVEKTGASEAAIKGFTDGETNDDEKLMCYMNCFFHEIDVVDDKGDVHLEKLFETVPEVVRDKLVEMSKDCVHPEGDTLCHKAWWFHKCWRKADPAHYFLP